MLLPGRFTQVSWKGKALDPGWRHDRGDLPDMAQPGWDFHPLTGDRKGRYAVEIRGLFRLVFEWENDEAVRVRQEDYHGK